MSQHDHTTPIETFLDDSDEAQRRDAAAAGRLDGTESGASGEGDDSRERPAPDARYATHSAPGPTSPAQGPTAVPEFRSGPAPTTTIVGLLGLLTTIALLVTQSTDLDIPWGVVGPVAVVGAGVLLVVLGLAGLRGQRFRG